MDGYHHRLDLTQTAGDSNIGNLRPARTSLLLTPCPGDLCVWCRLIREFEREARTDGMPASDLNFRKKAYVQVRRQSAGWQRASRPGCHLAAASLINAVLSALSVAFAAGAAGRLTTDAVCCRTLSWQELNGFIGLKKAYAGGAAARAELLDGAKSESEQLAGGCCWQLADGHRSQQADSSVLASHHAPCLADLPQHSHQQPGPVHHLDDSLPLSQVAPVLLPRLPRRCAQTLSRVPRRLLAGKSTQELMQLGRRDIKETDASLLRSEKIVNDTMAIGIQTAETLQSQTKQLEKVGAAQRAAVATRPGGARCLSLARSRATMLVFPICPF